MESYLFLIGGWIIYFVIHSVLADDSVKNYFKNLLGKTFRYYRLLYVFVSTAGLLYLIYYNERTGSERILATAFLILLGYGVMSIGAMIVILSFKDYSLRGFIGVAPEENKLKTNGLLQYVRHPIYSGTILIVIGYWFVSPYISTTISVICIFIYLAVGIQLEEKKLIKAFGEKYVRYQKEVPMLIPRIKF